MRAVVTVVEKDKSKLDFDTLTAELDKAGDELNVAIRVLHEDMFKKSL